LIRAVVESTETPVWAKLPLHDIERAAERGVEEGASALVIGQSPPGALPHSAGVTVRGTLRGPVVFPLMLESLLRVKALALPCALIACGGVHTPNQARTALDAGADAIQLDSVAWIEPGIVNALADIFK
jgi:dihydroorotate dehydrogenase (NAD+) catalytic subunit